MIWLKLNERNTKNKWMYQALFVVSPQLSKGIGCITLSWRTGSDCDYKVAGIFCQKCESLAFWIQCCS